jgi:hypothetical protein
VPETIALTGLWLALSADWSAQGVGLRQPEDFDFLRALYRITRMAEVAAADFDPLTAAAFLNSQFELQCRHFEAHSTLEHRASYLTHDALGFVGI